MLMIYVIYKNYCLLLSFISTACPLEVDLLPLSGPVSCTLSGRCTEVSCCMESVRINRAFQFHLKIDPCKMKLIFSIEKMQFERSLLDNVWGMYILLSTLKYEKCVHSFMYFLVLILSFKTQSTLLRSCRAGKFTYSFFPWQA